MSTNEWFKGRKWGIFVHYLNTLQNGSPLHTKGKNTTSWDECVNEFDVKVFASTLNDINCGYLIFTLGQGDIQWCAPNEAFRCITGYNTGEACSSRDLISDLLDELEKYDIPLFLYYTGDGPYKNEQAGKNMGYYDREKEVITDEFIENWGSVLKEYSLRYGNRIKGWWIDGCYDFFGYKDSHLFKLKECAKSGNPDALVAFNNGVYHKEWQSPKYREFYSENDHPSKQVADLEKAMYAGICDDTGYLRHEIDEQYRDADDYTPGERNSFTFYPYIKNPKKQWHILSFLGHISGFTLKGHKYFPDISEGWGSAGARYSGEYMREYVKKVNETGGVVTIDAALFRDGTMDAGQIEVLKYLKDIR